ncbi:MAG: chorismate synthase [Clostridia bacterium]|nr:chorismate synthase [Clostridia bacterium]
MSVWKGDRLTLEIFGESHSPEIGFNASGFPKIKLNEEELKKFTARRRSTGENYATPRTEPDEPIFLKGFDNGVIGGDIQVIIKNTNIKSGDYDDLYGKPRPSHADYAAYLKDGTLDFKGGGRFSGRMTAPYVLAGGILKQFSDPLGVRARAYISSVGKVKGRSYKDGEITKEELFASDGFSIGQDEIFLNEIARARAEGDSVGARIETVAFGVPKGLGNDLFEGLESKISSLLFAIPAVKGVEFGLGFAFSEMLGSEANDPLRTDGREIRLMTNNGGGINGGISNGEALTFAVALRPTPSIAKPQKTVDLIKKENCVITVGGRHDACVAVRALPVVESALYIALADEILKSERY